MGISNTQHINPTYNTPESAEHSQTKSTVHEQSVQQAVQTVGSSLIEQLEDPICPINSVIGQMASTAASKKISHQPDWLSQTYAGQCLQTANKEQVVFLSSEQRQSISIQPVLPQASRQKIGLLRVPGLQEANIPNFDYNISMANEALVLGQHFKNQVQNGTNPSFKALWTATRQWRVGQLNTQTSEDDIYMFCLSRIPANTSNKKDPHSLPSSAISRGRK